MKFPEGEYLVTPKLVLARMIVAFTIAMAVTALVGVVLKHWPEAFLLLVCVVSVVAWFLALCWSIMYLTDSDNK